MTGAVVEIIDPSPSGSGVLTPTVVKVNGVDVGWLAEEGLDVDQGDRGSPTRVSIVLLPSRVIIRGAEEGEFPDQEETEA